MIDAVEAAQYMINLYPNFPKQRPDSFPVTWGMEMAQWIVDHAEDK